MSGNTSLVSSTPGFVVGTYGALDLRNAALANTYPGLFASGDFTVSQRAAGANMSVDITQGRAFADPGNTHQGLYFARRTSATAYNTSADGGYTWTAADATNPRIDLLCLEVKDTAEDASGVTGWRFRIVDGTPSASATHQLETAAWPTIPSGVLPLAAIRVPAAATTITTANITNLNTVGGGRAETLKIATTETTTSTTYTRLATPDFLCVYVPSASSRVRFGYKAQWKISAATGTQAVALFVNGNQIKGPLPGGAPAAAELVLGSLGTFYSHLSSAGTLSGNNPNGFISQAGATADVSDVATGEILWAAYTTTNVYTPGTFELFGLPAGWYVLEVRYKTSLNTLSVQNRYTWSEVIG